MRYISQGWPAKKRRCSCLRGKTGCMRGLNLIFSGVGSLLGGRTPAPNNIHERSNPIAYTAFACFSAKSPIKGSLYI